MGDFQVPGKITDPASDIRLPPTEQDQKLVKKDYLDFLKEVLAFPCISVIKHYLHQSNEYKRKNSAMCLAEFRKDHPMAFWGFFCIDLFCHFLYIFIALTVAVRGLGIIEFFKAIF